MRYGYVNEALSDACESLQHKKKALFEGQRHRKSGGISFGRLLSSVLPFLLCLSQCVNQGTGEVPKRPGNACGGS